MKQYQDGSINNSVINLLESLGYECEDLFSDLVNALFVKEE